MNIYFNLKNKKLANDTQTGVNYVYIGDHFQLQIWRSSECLRWQDIILCDQLETTFPMFLVMKDHITQCNTEAH